MQNQIDAAKQSQHRPAPPARGVDLTESTPLHSVVQLQRQAGNQAVQALLRSGLIQPKLAISNPDDPEEREADNVANTVMRSHAGAPCSCSGEDEMCEECQQKQFQPTIQRRASAISAPAQVPRIVSDVLRSSGHPLDSATRSFFEPRFRHDFSGVRVHTDAKAAESAKAVQAKAFAVGRDVVFAAGEFAPETHEGMRLLGHELMHVVQQGEGAPQLRRNVKYDAAGNATAFEFRVGVELQQSFVELARKLALAGPIMDGDLRDLRTQALRFRGTVNDNERMFMAGLLDAANVAKLRGMVAGPGASITFTFASITSARIQHVIDLDRAGVPESVAEPAREGKDALQHGRFGEALTKAAEAEGAASKEILVDAGPFKPQAHALITFAQSHGVSLSQILQAMLAAASDNSAGDKVLAGTAYAIADEAGNSMAGDLLVGKIKVDALIPAAFGRLPISRTTVAFYVTAAQKTGLKGDTIYLQTNLDIANLKDRSEVIHELRHAEEDKAASPAAKPVFPVKNMMELRAYRAQARYILEQILKQAGPDQARSAREAAAAGGLALGALMLEGQTNTARFQHPLELVFRAAPAPFTRTPADIKGILALPPATIETAVLKDIEAGYHLSPGETGVVEGQAGESLIHWIFRL
jgi:hypothetical protein